MSGRLEDKGQDDQYRRAVAEHGSALSRLARSYEADADKRRDLLQEIHLGLWRSFAAFNGECSVRTWTYRIAHNVATTHVIRNRRHTEKLTSLEELNDAAHPLASPPVAEERHALDKLTGLIRKLNVIDHAVIVLYLEGEDAASIAAVTGLSTANVATKVSRIKKLLAQKFTRGSAP
jgi:RNA polymerase sigma-70 factor, ECF subfamily